MDPQLINDIISTSVGGAAGGAVAGIVIMAIQGIRSSWLDCRDSKRIYKWMVQNSDAKSAPFRSTRAIASHNNLSEDRVRFVCSHDERIKLSTGREEDMWSIHIRKRSTSAIRGVRDEK